MGVNGIGGFFFRADDPESLSRWYATHLGVGAGEFGQWEPRAGSSVFAPFQADTTYFSSDKQWMINFRVDDLDGMIAQLRDADIKVITKPEWDAPGLGRFARIHDPEGNPVELWQPDLEGGGAAA